MDTKELTYERKNIYDVANENEIKKIFDFCEGYKTFLDDAKTEREAVKEGIKIAEQAGFTEYKLGDKLSSGDKKYYNQKNKSLYLFKVGTGDLSKQGIRILASHIDNPRLDVKVNPIYEDGEMSFFKTHYYGGIKKYQWTTIPLALHGIVFLSNGKTVDVKIGEDDSDPLFYINDLLPHMSQKQVTEPLGKAFTGEDMNILVGSMPIKGTEDEKNKIKLNVLKLLNDKYGITEADFLSAELCLVPSIKARDIGLDRGLIGAFGHDDRSCSYSALKAIIEDKSSQNTSIVILADKEEIGSEGISGMQCKVFEDIFNEICLSKKSHPAVVRSVSKCLSADVTACYDPNFKEVYEKNNNALLSHGAAICKFTGSGGKSGASDASAELLSYVRNVFDANGVAWQSVEMGKVDVGGGGTVAKFIARLNIDTVDIGVPVISMHAPYEVVSKADVYSTYKAFVSFLSASVS